MYKTYREILFHSIEELLTKVVLKQISSIATILELFWKQI